MQLILRKRKWPALFFAFSTVTFCVNAQTYVGNVEFTSQSAVNSWDQQWKTVTGNIYITSLANDVITNLAPLKNLTSVGGAIIVSENHSLTSLTGLGGLTNAGAVEISFNNTLGSLTDLGGLTNVSGSLNIVGNASLTNLTGLSASLMINGDLTIRNNPSLILCEATAICNYQRTHSSSTVLNVSGNAGYCSNETTLYWACNKPLPVVLTEFDATGEGSSVRLRWATSAETNASHFDIERSRDGLAWQKAGVVLANGESLLRTEYSFSDVNPFEGKSLYRLRMNDFDDAYSYSRVRSVHIRGVMAPAYPNPFSASLSLSPRHAGAQGTVELTDARGKVIYQSKDQMPASIPTSQWQPGVYVLKLIDQKGFSTQLRVVKAQ